MFKLLRRFCSDSCVVTPEAAEQAVRIGEFTSLVPVDGFITLRECRRKGFSEAESRQICLLELYEHAPPGGGPLSVRIKRAGSLDGPEEAGCAR